MNMKVIFLLRHVFLKVVAGLHFCVIEQILVQCVRAVCFNCFAFAFKIWAKRLFSQCPPNRQKTKNMR